MISYKIEGYNHSLICDIEDELLQSKSDSKLDYDNGHTVIFGSDEYPLEADNVTSYTTTTSTGTQQPTPTTID